MKQRPAKNIIVDIRRRVSMALETLCQQAAARRVIVAVSGGVDSMSLLDVLLSLRNSLKLEIAVAHFNHQLRTEADSDARFVERVARKNNLEFFSDSADVAAIAAAQHVSTEMAGRSMRYAFFQRLLATKDFDAVATAHNRTDNAETVILNLVRGGGINALSGIPPRRAVDAKSIIRPLLGIDKTEIIAYAKARDLKWREDKSNREISIRRNFVRLTIVPELEELNPKYSEAISRTTTIVRDLMTHLRPEINRLKNELIKSQRKEHSVSIAIPALKTYFGSLHSIALHEILRETFPDVLFGAGDIDRVAALPGQQVGMHAQLESGILATRDRGYIKVTRNRSLAFGAAQLVAGSCMQVGGWTFGVREVPASTVIIGASNKNEFIDADATGNSFTVRPWRAGDAFVPLGMSTRKKLSDFLTDRKISNEERNNIFVMESNSKIIWVCGHRIDHRVRITSSTVRVLELSIAPIAFV